MSINPLRGEIWLVKLDPTVGDEMQKTRPTVVISSDAIRRLSIRLIAPITSWDQTKHQNAWFVPLIPDKINKLQNVSVVDTLQLRGLSLQRFIRKVGSVSATTMDDIAASIAVVIDFTCP